MEVAAHPYLAGVLCRSDGAIFVPSCGPGPSSHWTFGWPYGKDRYLAVMIAGRQYKVHRLMAETFLQYPIPDGMQIDHIDRNRVNNAKDNIRIVTPSENNRNRAVYSKCGISSVYDKAAYQRARYANDPEYREWRKARTRAYRAKKKGKGK